LKVKLVTVGEGEKAERFVLCRSEARAAKETAMLQQKLDRLRAELQKIDVALAKRPTRQVEPVERRIGRWLGRYAAAGAILKVEVKKDEAGRACGVSVTEQSEKRKWAQHAHGAYLLRTNHAASDPVQFWRWYIELTQAEAAFRTSKSDLRLRPIFHQKTERVEAHILVCFLALALWRALEQWLRSKGLGDCARQLLLELDELRSLDVVLPTLEGPEVRLRVVARPEKLLAQLLAHLGLELPRTPKIIEKLGNVVPKNGPSKTQVVAPQRSVPPG
jgi:hypothetical protein